MAAYLWINTASHRILTSICCLAFYEDEMARQIQETFLPDGSGMSMFCDLNKIWVLIAASPWLTRSSLRTYARNVMKTRWILFYWFPAKPIIGALFRPWKRPGSLSWWIMTRNRAELTEAEQKQFYNKYIKPMHLKIEENKDVTILRRD